MSREYEDKSCGYAALSDGLVISFSERFARRQSSAVLQLVRDDGPPRTKAISLVVHQPGTLAGGAAHVIGRDGLRVSELVSLKWEQIDFTSATLHVTRSKRA
jgi:integrase